MADRRPHVLLVTSDQHRGDVLGSAGHPCVRTPHLDLVAREGTVFDQAYVDCPVCIPARTTLITGRDAHHLGCVRYAPDHRIDRDRSDFLGSLVTAAGYQTALVGKRHWFTDASFRAGFETVSGFPELQRARSAWQQGCGGRRHGMGSNELSPGLSQLPPHLNSTQWMVEESARVVDQRDRTQPLFLWTSVTEPHPPNVVHEPYYSMYDRDNIPDPIRADWADPERAPWAIRQLQEGIGANHIGAAEMRKIRGVYYGMVTNIDHQIGRLIGALVRAGIWQDTVFIYTSDHGELLGDFGTFFKSNFLEGGARVPFVVRFPEWMRVARNVHHDGLIGWQDILPTICELTGARVPDDVTGASLLPLMRGEAQVRDRFHGNINGQHLWHDGRYKYLYCVQDGSELVFDKQTDPEERHDLSDDIELTGRLRREFVSHLQEEGHEHVDATGALSNEGQRWEPDQTSATTGWPCFMP
jgi:arylsulfatase A-like enzyme